MKKGLMKAGGMLLYLFLLLYLMGFQIKELFDLESFCIVIMGMCLLSFPSWIQEKELKKLRDVLSWNALFASYIAAIVLLTGTLAEGVLQVDLSKAVAAGLRPILYGLLFYVLFHREEKNDETDDTPVCLMQEESIQNGSTYTAEQMCYLFRSKGLTAREAEVARLLYLEYTNRMIAEELYISEATVKKHVTHILEKLNVESRGEIIRLVRESCLMQ